MGFFDKKSRQLRRKIRDLRGELKEAEKEGRFVRAQGIFFAELEDMGDMTIRVFGTSDLNAGQEESVIRTFFDRNGFTVEELKMAKGGSALAEVEIVPPNEVLMHAASLMKEEGYRVIDDGEREIEPDLEKKVFPISALARAISLLFAEKVQAVIASTKIKNNKEGNRLLRWMPEIVQALLRKVNIHAIESARPIFDDAYAYYYTGGPDKRKSKKGANERDDAEEPSEPSHESRAAIQANPQQADQRPLQPIRFGAPPESSPSPPRREGGHAQEASGREVLAEVLREAKLTFEEAFGRFSDRVTTRLGAKLARLGAGATPIPEGAPARPLDEGPMNKLLASEQTAKVLGAMYHSLVRAKPAKCVSNSETLLKFVNRLFNATATCILTRAASGDTMSVFAQAGKKLLWGEGGGKGFAISTSIVRNCVQQGTVFTSTPMGDDPSASMILHKIEAAAASPIIVGQKTVGVLYLDRREGATTFTSEDLDRLRKVTMVFQEFPDLTLGLPSP